MPVWTTDLWHSGQSAVQVSGKALVQALRGLITKLNKMGVLRLFQRQSLQQEFKSSLRLHLKTQEN